MSDESERETNRVRYGRTTTREADESGDDTEANRTEAGGTCSECGGTLVTRDGERVCSECDVVVGDSIDRGPEWRGETAGTAESKSRVGPAKDITRQDDGLGTQVGSGGPSTGSGLDKRDKSRSRRLQREQERTRRPSGKDQTLDFGLQRITTLRAAIPMADSTIVESAAEIFRKAWEDNATAGRKLETVIAGAAWLAARRENEVIPMKRLLDWADLDDGTIVRRTGRTLLTEADLGFEEHEKEAAMTHPQPSEHVRWMLAGLGNRVGGDIRTIEREVGALLDQIESTAIPNGRSPTGVAAGAIYTVWVESDLGVNPSQRKLADIADISTDTLVARHQEIREGLEAGELDLDMDK